jgi:hypothetical protein
MSVSAETVADRIEKLSKDGEGLKRLKKVRISSEIDSLSKASSSVITVISNLQKKL